jgi:hypothetical protein
MADSSMPAPTAGQSPLLASGRVRVWLAAGAALVLVAGVLLRPDTPAATVPIEETPAPILQEVVGRREALSIVQRLQETGRRSIRFAARVTLPPAGEEEWSDWEPGAAVPRDRFGVVLSERELLAHVGDVPAGTVVTVVLGNGRGFAARVTETWPDRGLGRLAVDSMEPLESPPGIASAVTPGDAVVGAAPGRRGEVIAPMFVASVDEDAVFVTSAIDRFRGLPVFTESGVLLGVVAATPSGTAVMPLSSATAPSPEPPGPARLLGMSLGLDAPGDEGARPVVITRVAENGPAAAARLRPGDILLAIDGTDVRRPGDAAAALEAGTDPVVRLRIRRGRQILTVRVTPAEELPR